MMCRHFFVINSSNLGRAENRLLTQISMKSRFEQIKSRLGKIKFRFEQIEVRFESTLRLVFKIEFGGLDHDGRSFGRASRLTTGG